MPTLSGHTSAICAGKVLGTNVFDTAGNQIGEIKDIVLDKQSNSIMFAVVSRSGVSPLQDHALLAVSRDP
jgi:uncharacterized protein YrrD